MPHFDGTVTLGTLLTILALAISFSVTYTKATGWLSSKFTQFQSTLDSHAMQLTKHTERMDRYEGRYVEIAGQLQRIIGRMEEQDKSPWPRNRRHEP